MENNEKQERKTKQKNLCDYYQGDKDRPARCRSECQAQSKQRIVKLELEVESLSTKCANLLKKYNGALRELNRFHAWDSIIQVHEIYDGPNDEFSDIDDNSDYIESGSDGEGPSDEKIAAAIAECINKTEE